MKCVAIHQLLLRAAAVCCLSVHKSLSSVIKILMVPAGYVWMFCIPCTSFGCIGISGIGPGVPFFNLMEQECSSYNNNNLSKSTPGYRLGIPEHKQILQATQNTWIQPAGTNSDVDQNNVLRICMDRLQMAAFNNR